MGLIVKFLNRKNHFLYILILSSFFINVGCTTLSIGLFEGNTRSSYTEKLDFAHPLTIKPKDSPVLLQEKIDTALYHFKKGRYSEACDFFIQSMNVIEDSKHPLSRECGKAAAVSALMDGDRKRFKRIMARIEHSFSALERITCNDKVYRELQTLATELE